MAQNFKRSEVVAGIARTALYGPVPAGTTAIVFAGTFTNIDTTNKLDHKITLEIRNAVAAYVPRFMEVPVAYGGASKCPKTVLLAGEYLYVTADAVNVMQAIVEVLERS
jgi:hypothetical protein